MEFPKWQEFLSDDELNDNLYLTPDGKYLFGKILHDILECLNMYIGCLEVSVHPQLKPEIHQNTLNWLDSKMPTVELLLLEIVPFCQYEKELPVESDEWPRLLERVGVILNQGFPNLLDGYKQLDMPVDSRSSFIVKAAVNNLRKLQLIWIDIQNQEYKRLWSIQKYGTLLDV